MLRILLIDDDDVLRATLREMLENAGFEVADEPDGASGLERFRREPADLVITDVIMPGKDGITTLGELHMEFPDVGIIAISGGDPKKPESNLPLAPAFGAAGTLQKPFTQAELVTEIRRVLEERGVSN